MTDLTTLTDAELIAAWQASGGNSSEEKSPEVEAIAFEMERRGIDL